MRVELKGKGGPLPIEAIPSGEFAQDDDSALVLNLSNGSEFDKTGYVEQGYTNYELLCVGAVGGEGGDNDLLAPGTTDFYFSKGGGGGGGGLHRVLGLLDDLPTLSAVVVGQPGTKGAYGDDYIGGEDSTLAPPGDGTDGGASSFNATTCMASGGKGGKRTKATGRGHVYMEDPTSLEFATAQHGGDGGEGGIGGRTLAGGGGAGGTHVVTAGAPLAPPTSMPTAPQDGSWDGAIGRGGGGGYGGTFINGAPAKIYTPSNGAKGSYSFGDITVYGPAGTLYTEVKYGGARTVGPGGGGGAKPRNVPAGGYAAGYSHAGVVLIRLTKVD